MRHVFPIAALTVLLIVLGPMPVFAGGTPLFTGGSSPERQYDSTEAELKLLNDQILLAYRADTEFIEKFKKAQLAWNRFKEAYLESLYPAKDKLQTYGSAYRRCYLVAVIELNRYRIGQLRVWVDGREEGDVCSGSIKWR